MFHLRYNINLSTAYISGVFTVRATGADDPDISAHGYFIFLSKYLAVDSFKGQTTEFSLKCIQIEIPCTLK